MNMSEQGWAALRDLIKGQEGLRLKVYDDATGKEILPGSVVKGHPTIGYGRALDTNGISVEEAEFLFQKDLLSIGTSIDSEFPWFDGLCEARKAVVVSMVFNIGLEGFKGFKGLISALERSDFSAAGSEMRNSLWAKELPARSNRLSIIMISGQT